VWTFEQFVEQSLGTTTVPGLRTLFERVLADEGFGNYFVGTVTDRSIIDIGWEEFPDGHFETYLAERWSEVDPILTLASRARRPFCWDHVAQGRRFNASQIALLDELKRVGVHSISVTPFQHPDGHCDMVAISRRHPEPPDPARLPVLQAICAQAWCRYADLAGIGLADTREAIGLTKREIEILQWIKHGKNNSEISEIMTVSIKTVEYHVGNILKKLGASNRTAAVVIAFKNNLLAL
jgi:DNA-binding CsgD family transcriptional regulator